MDRPDGGIAFERDGRRRFEVEITLRRPRMPRAGSTQVTGTGSVDKPAE
jgi:hypothetical protein